MCVCLGLPVLTVLNNAPPDGSEVNGERQVTICGAPDTVEYVCTSTRHTFSYTLLFPSIITRHLCVCRKAKALVSKVVEDAGGSLTNLPLGALVRFIAVR